MPWSPQSGQRCLIWLEYPHRRAGAPPWLCKNSMISRTYLASCDAWAIRSLRLGPIPSTDCSSAGDRIRVHGKATIWTFTKRCASSEKDCGTRKRRIEVGCGSWAMTMLCFLLCWRGVELIGLGPAACHVGYVNAVENRWRRLARVPKLFGSVGCLPPEKTLI